MEILVIGAVVSLATLLILAAAAVRIIRITTHGTDSAHRADVLSAVATVLRGIRGKR
ncbi:hypothetical protein ACIGBH_11980 [Streptomyces sp. NPDC085929]|uniref:hypothetical protein n=1 Tax=Streptomyces sp. NPDC085929 TaxID=3365739 RepID=UPI0037CD55CB